MSEPQEYQPLKNYETVGPKSWHKGLNWGGFAMLKVALLTRTWKLSLEHKKKQSSSLITIKKLLIKVEVGIVY